MSTPEVTVYDDSQSSNTSVGIIEKINLALDAAGIEAAPALYEEALELARSGLLGAARDRLRMLLCLDPENGDARLLLAKVFVGQQRWSDALAMLDAARTLGMQVPASLAARVDAGLEAERNAVELLKERTATREQAELQALRTEARKLRTENTRLTCERKQLKGRAGLWSATTAALTGVSLVLVAFAWLGPTDAPEAIAAEPAAVDVPAAPLELAEAPLPAGSAPEPAVAPAATPVEEVDAADAPAEPVPAEAEAQVEEPVPQAPAAVRGPRKHTVVAGDSLYELAKRYYGDGEKWEAIKDANPTRISRHHGLTLGTELVIP